MRRASIFVWLSLLLALLPLCVTGRASAKPSDSETPPTLFEQFRQMPTAQNALQFAKDGLNDPTELRIGLMLTERHARLLAWALYHYPAPAVRKDLEQMLKSPDQVAGYWAAKALGRIADTASIPALGQQFPPEGSEFWEVNSGGPDARRRMYYFRYNNCRVSPPVVWRSTPRRTCRTYAWPMRRWKHWVGSAERKPKRSWCSKWPAITT